MTDNYLTYSIEDFAADEEFIAWVQENKFDEKWTAATKLSVEVKERMEAARLLVSSLRFNENEETSEIAAVWARIEATTQIAESQTPHVKSRIIPMWSRWAAGAAAILVLLLLAWPALRPYEMVKTDAKDALTYSLPDQSTVILDDVSELTVYDKNWDDERRLFLSGTAFFEVEKGNTFRVETEHGSVTVLGTSFSVEARSGIFRVVCRSGRVQVDSEGQQNILVAGESSDLKPEGLMKNTIPSQDYLLWIKGTYRYQNSLLSTVFAELERQFDVNVSYTPEVASMLFTGPFDSSDLNKALEAVCWPMNLEWIVDGDTIIIQDPASI